MTVSSEQAPENRTTGTPLIIVSGLPRSGTSMLMRMLESGGVPVLRDDSRAPDENNPNGYYELERVKRLHRDADKSWLADGEGKALKVVSWLLPHLPETRSYRVIFMLRPLREVVASQNRMLDVLSEPRGNENDDRLIESYERHLAQVQSFLDSRPSFTTLQVKYRDVIADPATECQRIARFVGRELDVAGMSHVVDPHLRHQT
jgi:hypothetical protein